MAPSQDVKIVKIPLSQAKMDRPKSFPKMPRLYLELIENKDVVKQDLINKEYIPNESLDNSDPQNESVKKSVSTSSDSDNEIIELKEDISTDSDSSSDESVLNNRLKDLISDDSDSDSKKKRRKHTEEKHVKKHRIREERVAPSLAELESKGKFDRQQEFRDINMVSRSEEDEEEHKRELLFKFELLRKSYKGADIPEFNIHSDYDTMNRSYEQTVRRLSLDDSLAQYKQFLIGGFMLTEYLLGNFVGFDMKGFTQQQLISMSSYEKLLIELGEKSFTPLDKQWPVEVRLAGLILINAGFFLLSKMFIQKTGNNILGMINSMNNAVPSAIPTAPKRKMRGPNIDLNDIPDAEDL